MKAKQFSDYVSDVKNGGSANAVAHDIYDALTENERIALLQGSVPFWQGIDAMMGPDVGYNAQPFVMGAVERIGFPGSGSLMAARMCCWNCHGLPSFDGSRSYLGYQLGRTSW